MAQKKTKKKTAHLFQDIQSKKKNFASKLMVIWSGDGCEYTPLLYNTSNSF